MSDLSVLAKCGVVVIGRNEGERLRTCLTSVVDLARVVYVDSGSADDSVQLARTLGAIVVDLDMSRPFSAARARNAGMAALLSSFPDVDFVQFVDGDCELHAGWLDSASRFLDQHDVYAMVCGRLRERYPARSVYNWLCDIEWDGPPGDILSCGGVAMGRISALLAVGGFNELLIAGEEPELCYRLRRLGWKVWRIDRDMAHHDAAMTRFGQWWIRVTRSGYAYAEVAWLHRADPERFWIREVLGAVLFGAVLPVLASLSMLFFSLWGGLLLAVYPFQCWRLRAEQGGWKRAFYLVLGKFPEAIGALRFCFTRVRGATQAIIEYK